MPSNHTPGPWQYLTKLSGSENHKGFRIVCEKRDWWWLADTSPVDPNGVEGEANARLMAAAPDLLAALEYACEAEWDGLHEPTWMAVARVALKKATG